jgi:hypothetical protein
MMTVDCKWFAEFVKKGFLTDLREYAKNLGR